MKMVKPIVNISKIIENYDAVVCGFNGVLHNGKDFFPQVLETLINIKKSGKKLALVSNTSDRVEELVKKMYEAGISPRVFETVVTAGEILHQKLAAHSNRYDGLGHTYYNIGDVSDKGIFQGLNYQEVANSAEADFLYAGRLSLEKTRVEEYLDILTHCASLNIPMLCIGNDISMLYDEDIVMASGSIAEQYAVLGGKILTIGKPDLQVLQYTIEAFGEITPQKILMIGDSMSTDIKSSVATGLASCLISRGIHRKFLGEGYIPDVTKTKDLAAINDAFPDYVISGFRW